jgi:hypothetical protein
MRDANTPIRSILRADAAFLLGDLGHGQIVRTFLEDFASARSF